MPELKFSLAGFRKERLDQARETESQTGKQNQTRTKLRGTKLSTLAPIKIGLVLATLYAVTNSSPAIRLDLPGTNNVVTLTGNNHRVVNIKGRVLDPTVNAVTIDENGLQWQVPVQQDGSFFAPVALMGDRNAVQVLASGMRSNLLNVSSLIPRVDIWTQLTWDGPADIDLHLVLPDGEECFYENKQVRAGARLDLDNTIAFGPEHITMDRALAGEYKVAVVYFASQTKPTRPVHWEVVIRRENNAIVERQSGELEKPKNTAKWTFNFPNGPSTAVITE
jgi:uncharacterized protein YfaP (DUF2135 family)